MDTCLGSNLIFIIANPMMDITKEVTPNFLLRYRLKSNSAIVYSKEGQNGLFEDIEDSNSVRRVGGSTLNTARILQWILRKPKTVTVFGAVGKDENARIIENTLREENIECLFKHIDNIPTGKCAVLVTADERSLCTNLGASERLNLVDLIEENTWQKVITAKIYYASAFFFGVSPEIIFRIARHSWENDKLFLFNIGAPFLTEKYKSQFLELFPFINILFGNEEEMIALAKILTDKQLCVKNAIDTIAKNQKKDTNKERIVVTTRGSHPVLVHRGNEIEVYPVATIDSIEDTNAAGDAFVGGFLAQFLQKKGLNTCVNCGIWAARHVIQNVGCTFDLALKYNEDN